MFSIGLISSRVKCQGRWHYVRVDANEKYSPRKDAWTGRTEIRKGWLWQAIRKRERFGSQGD